ncbi:MAG: DUF5928 domain-containing protein, partial [Paracoccaceae bacterium]
VVIHYDRNARGFEQIRRALHVSDRIAFAGRWRCGWGDWSLVGATLAAARMGLRRFPQASHMYLVSGDCHPIASARSLHDALDGTDVDYIETQDFLRSGWIKTGLCKDRLIYRHLFNERRHPRLFYGALSVQKRMGWSRRFPPGLDMRIGSQWWCLRRRTVAALLAFLDSRRDVRRFFRTVWIPDECAIQTLVWHLVPEHEIYNRPPTFLMFTDYGMPVCFHTDHLPLLVGQTGFFARKISPNAQGLRAALAQRWCGDDTGHPGPQPDARRLHGYVTRRGRVGLRHAPCAWGPLALRSPAARAYVVLCKKWSVGKRLVADLGQVLGAQTYGYLFDETAQGDPDLGGMGRDLARRKLDVGSYLESLFADAGGDQVVLGLDPSQVEVLNALQLALPDLRVLELQCHFSDEDLRGHAMRLGLVPADMAQDTAPAPHCAAGEGGHTTPLWPMLRRELAAETARLRDAHLPCHYCLTEADTPENTARTIADFLQVPHQQGHDMAHHMVNRPGLFND